MSIINNKPVAPQKLGLVGEEFPVPCLCGRKIGFSRDEDGAPDGVMHEEPQCSDFKKRDPIAFLAFVRQGGRS